MAHSVLELASLLFFDFLSWCIIRSVTTSNLGTSSLASNAVTRHLAGLLEGRLLNPPLKQFLQQLRVSQTVPS